jgi:tRNA pseudouridine38-40 synthase
VPGEAPAAPQLRLRLDLAYDGSGFSGWARQPSLRTVQDTVETALARVLRLPATPLLTVAGRTDAGVHARGQVAHVDVPAEAWAGAPGRSQRPPGPALVRRLAAVLPPDVVVRKAGVAPAGFDARFSALWRRYEYRVVDDPARRDPLRRSDVLWHPRPLDVPAMADAAHRLQGEHDFAAFCRAREGATTIRELLTFRWSRTDAGLAVADVRADAFCHSMVRALVGACLAVGEGRRPVRWPAEVLLAGHRDPAVTVAAPGGLTLEEVAYPADADLAGRAERARRVRTLPGSAPSAPAQERAPRAVGPG